MGALADADQVKIANRESTNGHTVTSMLDWALFYAQNWRPVFPCIWWPGDYAKQPRIPKRDGGNGFHDATLDPDQIREWWTRWPQALIGSRVPYSQICVDVDPRKGVTIRHLDQKVGELPETQAVISGRRDGGMHLFFYRHHGQHVDRTKLRKTFLDGIDIKTWNDGYTILPVPTPRHQSTVRMARRPRKPARPSHPQHARRPRAADHRRP
jgi:Bifunctional DNA primase/polymerase, N-terminal